MPHAYADGDGAAEAGVHAGDLPRRPAHRAAHAGPGPTRVYLIGSIHGDEPEGCTALDDIRRALDASTGGTTVRFVQDMNPDGSFRKSGKGQVLLHKLQ